jgi:hypothetical protein
MEPGPWHRSQSMPSGTWANRFSEPSTKSGIALWHVMHCCTMGRPNRSPGPPSNPGASPQRPACAYHVTGIW